MDTLSIMIHGAKVYVHAFIFFFKKKEYVHEF